MTYDITNPKVYIDYKFDVVKSGYSDTICWVYFNERVNPAPDYKPKISIQFLDDPNTIIDESALLLPIEDADMTIVSINGVEDSTKWFYEGTIPFVFDSSEISCATNVTITAQDLAGNLLPTPLNRCDEGIVDHDSKALCDAGAAAHSDGVDGHYVGFNGVVTF